MALLLTVLAAKGRLVGARVAQQIGRGAAASVAQIWTTFAANGAALAVVQALGRAVGHLGVRGAVCGARAWQESSIQFN